MAKEESAILNLLLEFLVVVTLVDVSIAECECLFEYILLNVLQQVLDALNIAGLSAGMTATVYNAAGVMVTSMTESGHCSLVPGTYVVTVGELTSKVVVK